MNNWIWREVHLSHIFFFPFSYYSKRVNKAASTVSICKTCKSEGHMPWRCSTLQEWQTRGQTAPECCHCRSQPSSEVHHLWCTEIQSFCRGEDHYHKKLIKKTANIVVTTNTMVFPSGKIYVLVAIEREGRAILFPPPVVSSKIYFKAQNINCWWGIIHYLLNYLDCNYRCKRKTTNLRN